MSQEASGEVVQRVSEKYPAREKQLETLLKLFGSATQPVPSPLLLLGDTATGKTSVIQELLTACNLHHVFVNCVECYNPKLLFERILQSFPDPPICRSVPDFLVQLKRQLGDHNSQETFYIVLDRAERLRALKRGIILDVFCRLKEKLRRNVCVILVSQLPWYLFESRVSADAYYPVVVFFPTYTAEEMAAIITHCYSSERVSKFQLLKHLVKYVYQVFKVDCNDLNEIRYAISCLLPTYEKLVETHQISDPSKLKKVIEPHVRAVHKNMFRRDADFLLEQKQPKLKDAMGLELPFAAKFILVAAYLASYIPMHLDTRFFSLLPSESKRKRRRTSKLASETQFKTSRQSFRLERLLAIFFSIQDHIQVNTADLYSQISSLVSLHLLTKVNQSLDDPMFQCNVNLEVIRSIVSEHEGQIKEGTGLRDLLHMITL